MDKKIKLGDRASLVIYVILYVLMYTDVIRALYAVVELYTEKNLSIAGDLFANYYDYGKSAYLSYNDLLSRLCAYIVVAGPIMLYLGRRVYKKPALTENFAFFKRNVILCIAVVTAVILAVDLYILVEKVLSGHITWSFLLKSLVLFVAAFVFYVQNINQNHGVLTKVVAYGLYVFFPVLIGWMVLFVGSPVVTAGYKHDKKMEHAIERAKDGLMRYADDKHTIPMSKDEFSTYSDLRYGLGRELTYDLIIGLPGQFQFCGVFEQDADVKNKHVKKWIGVDLAVPEYNYKAGKNCFRYQAVNKSKDEKQPKYSAQFLGVYEDHLSN